MLRKIVDILWSKGVEKWHLYVTGENKLLQVFKTMYLYFKRTKFDLVILYLRTNIKKVIWDVYKGVFWSMF